MKNGNNWPDVNTSGNGNHGHFRNANKSKSEI